jgi:hypothetical protein
MVPRSRGWGRLLDHVADAHCERELIAALELTVAELKADVATWRPITSTSDQLPSTAE